MYMIWLATNGSCITIKLEDEKKKKRNTISISKNSIVTFICMMSNDQWGTFEVIVSFIFHCTLIVPEICELSHIICCYARISNHLYPF